MTHAQIQMARALGLNSKKFSSLVNHKQQPWKVPLPDYIEELYYKHFKKEAPDQVKSIEEMIAHKSKKRMERKARKALEKPQGDIQKKEANKDNSSLFNENDFPF